jgi:hypothetical protein
MRGPGVGCWGIGRTDCAFPQRRVNPQPRFPQIQSRCEREFRTVVHRQSTAAPGPVDGVWTSRYSAASSAPMASVSTCAASRQSLSDADSAGVWLAPVGFRTNSIAAGRSAARMPASWPA